LTNLTIPSQPLKPFGLELVVQELRRSYFRLRHFGCTARLNMELTRAQVNWCKLKEGRLASIIVKNKSTGRSRGDWPGGGRAAYLSVHVPPSRPALSEDPPF